jgi:hypothetical protein
MKGRQNYGSRDYNSLIQEVLTVATARNAVVLDMKFCLKPDIAEASEWAKNVTENYNPEVKAKIQYLDKSWDLKTDEIYIREIVQLLKTDYENERTREEVSSFPVQIYIEATLKDVPRKAEYDIMLCDKKYNIMRL